MKQERDGAGTWLNATNCMLCWTPKTDKVKLIFWPDTEGRSRCFDMSTLACNSFMHELSFNQRKAIVFIEAMHLIVRDGCDPKAVHHALLGLAEYRDGCSDDMLRKF